MPPGGGCRDIATRLTREGIHTRRGGNWGPTRIYEVITNPAYIGAGVYGRKQYYKKDDGSRDVKHHKKMPETSWITVEYPRIVDDVTWHKAQAERRNPTRDSRTTGRKHNAHYLLKGLLWCAHCESKYTAEAGYRFQYRTLPDGSKIRKSTDDLRIRYVCVNGIKTQNGCTRKWVYGKAIEPKVWEAVTEFLTNPEQIHQLIQERRQALAEGTSPVSRK